MPGAATSTPFIITATLPPTAVPSATLTAIPPTPSPTIVPVQGMTTTQVNVRGQPSSAAPQLGMLPPFVNVQIVARDADTNWYEILYQGGADGKGWVSAQFLNITQGADTIPEAGGATGNTTPVVGTPVAGTTGATIAGVLIQQVNVRTGPGTGFDAIGTLEAQDTVTLTGQDASGSWFQIEFAAGQEGKGWVAAGFVQASGTEQLPVVGSSGSVIGTGTPAAVAAAVTPTPGIAFDDQDSAEAPAATVSLSPTGTRGLFYSSDLSAPHGDDQDWIEFTTSSPGILINLSCTGNSGLGLRLTQDGRSVPDWVEPGCGDTRDLLVSPGKIYLIQVSIAGGDAASDYIHYTLKVETTP